MFSRPVLLLTGGLFLAWSAAGCARPAGPIFNPTRTDLAWPPPPQPARIRYLGRLHSAADLHAARGPLAALGDLAVGKKKPPELFGPRAAWCTARGDILWIADPGGRCLHRFNLVRRTYKRLPHAGDTPFLTPVDVCQGPDDSFFVCDSEAIAIYRLDVHTGALRESLRVPTELLRPAALAYDPAARELFVVDAAAHNIEVLDAHGRLRRILGHRGAGPGEFNYPCGIAAAGKLLWIADAGNHRIQAITPAGAPVTQFGRAGDAPGNLALPKDVALDSDGHIYVVDARFENVQIFDATGRLLLFFGEEGSGPGEFWLPGGLFIDARDRIWLCDTYNRRVQVFQYLRRAPDEAPPGGETP